MLNYKILKQSEHASWIVFISGFTATYELWASTCNYLLNKNYSILLIDNLGAGKSPQPSGKYTTDIMATEVIKVITELGLSDINLVGHSLGGAIAQKITIQSPPLVKHLYLLSTFARMDNVARYFLMGRYELMQSNVDKRIVALSSIPSIFANEFLANPKNVDLAIERVISNPQTLDGMYGQLHACLDHDSQRQLSEIHCKTTILTGKDDILIHPKHSEILNTGIEHSSLLIIDGVGHMVPLEQPQRLAELF